MGRHAADLCLLRSLFTHFHRRPANTQDIVATYGEEQTCYEYPTCYALGEVTQGMIARLPPSHSTQLDASTLL